MFNFLVSGNDESWGGAPMSMELGRCVREYTDDDLTKKYGDLDSASVAELLRLPAIFAYEEGLHKDPLFGQLTRIEKRANRGEVRLDYALRKLPKFLTNEDLWSMKIELDITGWEPSRTHWALKQVDLFRELAPKGIILPPEFAGGPPAVPTPLFVDVSTHVFDVAFSFPGEYRPFVEAVVRATVALLRPHACFYDNNYQGQLARPSLDILLQDIYRRRSKLLVVFIGSNYQNKTWPNIEWRAIREVLNAREHSRIMYVRMDHGEVDGVFQQDGYIDASLFPPDQVARFIAERVALLPRP